jgi:uncharacterized protein (DUF1499 family)
MKGTHMGALQWILVAVGIVVVGGAVAITGGLYALSRNQPTTEEIALGVQGGSLTACPDSPNCVSTQADPNDTRHYVEPIPFGAVGGRAQRAAEVIDLTAKWVQNREDGEIVERSDTYLRAVFTSDVFGFKDDVEVYVAPSEGSIHFRSASRVGQGDMGVNRKRYQDFRAAISEDASATKTSASTVAPTARS